MKRRHLVAAAWLCGVGAAAGPAWAQLGGPLQGAPTPPPGAPGGSKPWAGAGSVAAAGSHTVPPLVGQVPGTVPWTLLASVSTRPDKGRLVPTFPPAVRDLNNTVVKVQGFMMPLQAAAGHTHFILSASSSTCAFCVSGGPETMIEVRTKRPVKYSIDPLIIEGRLAVLSADPSGLYYRLTDGVQLPLPANWSSFTPIK
jgi:hypothetical protein